MHTAATHILIEHVKLVSTGQGQACDGVRGHSRGQALIESEVMVKVKPVIGSEVMVKVKPVIGSEVIVHRYGAIVHI